jgi:hypothetical protein
MDKIYYSVNPKEEHLEDLGIDEWRMLNRMLIKYGRRISAGLKSLKTRVLKRFSWPTTICGLTYSVYI